VRRALIPTIVIALAVAGKAGAHVTVSPTRAAPGADVLLTFVVPNETKADTITGLSIHVPAAFDYEGVEAPSGWRRTPGAAEWDGGRIGPGDFVTFGLTGSAARRGEIVFNVDERYASGTVTHYRPTLTVAAPAPPAARDRGAHTLGIAALIVAGAAAALALAGFFLALAVWLRGPESLQERKREPVVPSDK
jgi:hypothetical protein